MKTETPQIKYGAAVIETAKRLTETLKEAEYENVSRLLP